MGYEIAITMVVVYFFIKYVEPRLEIFHDMYSNKKSAELEELKNKVSAMNCELVRRYPELKQFNETTHAIGYNTREDYEDYDCEECDEGDCEECEEPRENTQSSKLNNKISNKKIGFTKT